MNTIIIILLIITIILLVLFEMNSIKRSNEAKSGQIDISQINSRFTDTELRLGNSQSKSFERMDGRIDRLSSDMNTRLERLSRSMGEMQSLTNTVEDLKKVLSNVKTRGILGEWQLSAILQEIMSPTQYEENVATIPNSKNHVEFAIKMPSNGNSLYLPIDSKFPLDAYYNLLDAYDTSDPERVDEALKVLLKRVEQFAKDIKTKYIAPPHTTDFGIMFIPVEGLYIELINSGMSEILQTKYKITLAGPSTLAVLLNSLQMGFKTLAVNEKATDIWNQLNSIKGEFEKFDAVLQKAYQHIQLAEKDIDDLMGVRTRQILRQFEKMEK